MSRVTGSTRRRPAEQGSSEDADSGWRDRLNDGSTSGNQARKGQKQTFAGTVEGFRDASMKQGDDRPQRHNFVKIRLQDGESGAPVLQPWGGGTRLFPHLREIGFAPNDCDTIFVGTEPAELFRSRDSGRTWESLGLRSLPESDSWSLPYSPRAGALRTMFLSRNDRELIYAGIEQGGIAKSVDGGASWEMLGGGVHKDIHWIDSYWFDPDLIFAATGGGLFRSSDGGASWQRLLDGYTRAVHLRPRQEDVLLAGPAEDVGEGGELLLSRDGGDRWEGIGNGLGKLPMADMIECFLIAKELPDTAFAVRSNGQLYEADYGRWQWRQVAAEVENIQTVSLVRCWER